MKNYPTELLPKIEAYREARIVELVSEGFSRDCAEKIAEQEIIKKWGEK